MNETTSGRIYQVTRFCCRGGDCFECHQRGSHGDLRMRSRQVQARDLTIAEATKVAAGWRDYEARVEPMPEHRKEARA